MSLREHPLVRLRVLLELRPPEDLQDGLLVRRVDPRQVLEQLVLLGGREAVEGLRGHDVLKATLESENIPFRVERVRGCPRRAAESLPRTRNARRPAKYGCWKCCAEVSLQRNARGKKEG